MTRDIALIGAGSGLGAGVRDIAEGPAALERFGLARRLSARGVDAYWHAMLEFSRAGEPALSRTAYFTAVAQRAAQLAEIVAACTAKCLPVVLGGDHSLAMGTWAGVSRARGSAPIGLVWFDAHLDAHTPETTPSMNAHGMPVAALLGYGHPLFRALAGGAVDKDRLCCIGVRAYEPEEMAFLRALGVRVMLMPEVRRRGVAAALEEAFTIAGRGSGAYGMSFDLDGFDPDDAPGVGLPEPGGMEADAVCAALARGLPPGLAALEIVEYLPRRDSEQITARLVVELLAALLA